MRAAIVFFSCGIVACSSQSASNGAASEPIAVDVCDSDGFHPSRDLSPAHAVDYVSLRGTFGVKGAGGLDLILDESGLACRDAVDPTTCRQHLDMVLGLGWPTPEGRLEYLLATVKDDVIVYPSTDDLLKFFGTIDTAHEAALLARSRQLIVDCTLHPHAYAVGGSFRLLVKRLNCTDAVVVQSDGTMGIERNVLKDSGCPDDIDGGVDDAAPPPPSEGKPL
ncbi:MAG: hypothetical protein ACXVEF_36950 [Polyangiales bacterium]